MKFCPECGTKNETNSQKFCTSCGASLTPAANVDTTETRFPGNHPPSIVADVSHRSLLEQELLFKQRKGKHWIAIVCNILWAGSGNYYAGAPHGGGLCFLTFIGWCLSFFGIGLFIITGSFIIASILCFKQIDITNQKLKIRIASGKLN